MNNYLELLREFIKTDFKLRYKNSYLGIIWIILKPLATFSVIYVVWSNIMVMDADYKMGLLLGIMLMSFFNEGVMMGLGALMAKSGVILKIKFPREVVVISAVTISFIDFLLNMIVFAIFSIFTPVTITFISFLLFAVSVLTLYILIMALGLFLSIIFIRLKDIHNLTEVILQLLFWLTPIYYQLEMLPENLQKYVLLNPLTTIVISARKGIITGDTVTSGDFLPIGIIALICIALLLIAVAFFKKRVTKLAEYF
ncbi:MAG TPA: ABC transporter permease [Candidatus Dojkabacteria bacterium]|jgi:ABC-type polysaccharide/polyol phosphate export permease|nr:ABC transporter permease [Candidatus Dojkabacteria bacterium]